MKKNLILGALLICTLNMWPLSGCNKPSTIKTDDKITSSTEISCKNNNSNANDTNSSNATPSAWLPSKESLTPIFHKLINDFLQAENNYIYVKTQNADSVCSFLSSDSSLRNSYKELKNGKEVTEARLFQQLGSVYDKIEKLDVLSPTSAKVVSTRYIILTQTCQLGYSLRNVSYDLVLENSTWLIKSMLISECNDKPKDLCVVNVNVDNDKILKSIETYCKNDSNFDIKTLKLIQSIQYEDRILATVLRLNPFNDVIIENYFICPLTNKVIFSNISPYNPNNNDVIALTNEDFKEIYSKAKDILASQKPLYYSDMKFSNKTPLIATIMICKDEYIVCYFDGYNIDNGQLKYDFNTAVFYKKNNNLILKSNRNCFDD